jgi:hypothetical protein
VSLKGLSLSMVIGLDALGMAGEVLLRLGVGVPFARARGVWVKPVASPA